MLLAGIHQLAVPALKKWGLENATVVEIGMEDGLYAVWHNPALKSGRRQRIRSIVARPKHPVKPT